MKKIGNNIKIIFALVLFVSLSSSTIKAQSVDNMFLNFDWQLNAPISTKYADQFSGWGASADAGYYVTDHIGIGAYVSYHTNRKYISTSTIDLSNNTQVTTDQQHSIYQLPFGLSARYNFMPKNKVQPYFALKLGTEYSKVSSYMNVFEVYEKKWGFNISPEIGTTVYVDPQNRFGVHVAAYYSYSTNKSEVFGYSVKDFNNVGLRLGVSF